MPFYADFKVASLTVFPPKGNQASEEARRFVRYRIKQARGRTIEMAVDRLADVVNEGGFEGYFEADAVVVPVPGHAPQTRDSLWVPRIIGDSMVAAGLGRVCLPCLQRTKRVPRQSLRTSASDRLNPVEQLDSLDCQPSLELGDNILLVDDVVTRGATLIAAATCLARVRPQARIRAFALVRVSSEPIAEVADMLAPLVEKLHCDEEGRDPERRGLL